VAVDDDEVKVTQSLEEQTPDGQAAFEAQAAELGANRVTLLPGGHYDGASQSLWVCSPRAAGPAAPPTALLATPIRFLGLTVTPGSTPRSYAFTATFDREVSGFDADRFIVRGMQTGVRFVGEAYSGDGTAVVTTPVATFRAGEMVEVVLKAGEACVDGLPYVARHRVATGAASGNFVYNFYVTSGEYAWAAVPRMRCACSTHSAHVRYREGPCGPLGHSFPDRIPCSRGAREPRHRAGAYRPPPQSRIRVRPLSRCAQRRGGAVEAVRRSGRSRVARHAPPASAATPASTSPSSSSRNRCGSLHTHLRHRPSLPQLFTAATQRSAATCLALSSSARCAHMQ